MDDFIEIEGVFVSLKRSRDTEEDALDFQHELMFKEIKRLRSAYKVDPPKPPPPQPPPPPNQPTEPVVSEDTLAAVMNGQFIVLPAHHPNAALRKISITFANCWATDAHLEGRNVVIKSPKALAFPSFVRIEKNGSHSYVVDRDYSCLRLELALKCVGGIRDLMVCASQLVANLNGRNASADASAIEKALEFKAFVVRDDRSTRDEKVMIDTVEHRPSVVAWPCTRVEGEDPDVAYFLQTREAEPIECSIATVSNKGELVFELYFRPGTVRCKRVGNAPESNRVRLAIKPVSTTLAKLSGWTFVTPPFEIRSRYRSKNMKVYNGAEVQDS